VQHFHLTDSCVPVCMCCCIMFPPFYSAVLATTCCLFNTSILTPEECSMFYSASGAYDPRSTSSIELIAYCK
jgi:hypothetical protein